MPKSSHKVRVEALVDKAKDDALEAWDASGGTHGAGMGEHHMIYRTVDIEAETAGAAAHVVLDAFFAAAFDAGLPPTTEQITVHIEPIGTRPLYPAP